MSKIPLFGSNEFNCLAFSKSFKVISEEIPQASAPKDEYSFKSK